MMHTIHKIHSKSSIISKQPKTTHISNVSKDPQKDLSTEYVMNDEQSLSMAKKSKKILISIANMLTNPDTQLSTIINKAISMS